MSRYHRYAPVPVVPTMPTVGHKTTDACSLSCLVILILIILQFSKGKGGHKGKLVDNGILFIIALFYLACVGCGTKTGGCC
jgi:hypothetical protein